MADSSFQRTPLTKTSSSETKEQSFSSDSYYIKSGTLLISTIHGTMRLMHYAPNYPFLGYPSEGYRYEKEKWGEDNDMGQVSGEKSDGSVLKKFERLIPVLQAILASDCLGDLLSIDFQFTTVDKILYDLGYFVEIMKDYMYKIETLKLRKDMLFTLDELRDRRDQTEDAKDQRVLDTLALIKKKMTPSASTTSPLSPSSSSSSSTTSGSPSSLLMMDPTLGLINIPNTPIIANALMNMSTVDMEVLDMLFSLTIKESLPWVDHKFGLLTSRDLTYKEDNFRNLVNQFLALQDIIGSKLTDLNQEAQEVEEVVPTRAKTHKPKKPPKCVVQSTVASVGPIVGFCAKHY